MTKIAIVVGSKGRGSNMRSIITACQSGKLPATVTCVIAPTGGSPAVKVAQLLNIETIIPSNFDQDLLWILQSKNVNIVCLAGYMRLIPEHVVEAYEGRMLNIHPTLLPKFGGKGMWGMKVHEAVLAAGESESGCTVHFVSDKYDEGAILHQCKCPVLDDDTPESLAARVLDLEHLCYVEALAKLI